MIKPQEQVFVAGSLFSLDFQAVNISAWVITYSEKENEKKEKKISPDIKAAFISHGCARVCVFCFILCVQCGKFTDFQSIKTHFRVMLFEVTLLQKQLFSINSETSFNSRS